MSRFTLLPQRTTATPSVKGSFKLLLTSATALPTSTKAAKLCIYDYDIYNSSQVAGHGADPSTGFWEIDSDYFTGKKPGLPSIPQRHSVGAGTGLLATVDLTFRRSDTPLAPTISTRWYVDPVAAAPPSPSPGPEVEIQAPSRSGSTFEWRVVARITWPGPDYQRIRSSGVTLRRLAFRLFEPDGKTILLSSRNPAHCAVTPVFFEASLVHASQQSTPKGTPPPPQPSPPTRSRVPRPDPSGYFVEMVPGLTKAKATKLVVNDHERAVAASGLYLNAAGDAVVGWYYMLDAVVRDAAIFDGNLSDSRLEKSLRMKLGSPSEHWYDNGVLIAHSQLDDLTSLPADRRIQPPSEPNVLRAYYLRSATLRPPDPFALLDGHVFDVPDDVYQGYMVFDHGPAGILDVKLVLKIEGTKHAFTFSRLYARSRLPHEIFDIIGASQSGMSAAEYAAYVKCETAPIPSGTRTWLMQRAGERLTTSCKGYGQYVDSDPQDLPSVRRGKIAIYVLAAAKVVTEFFGPLQHYTEELVQLLSSEAISRSIYIGNQNRMMRDVLYQMLGELLTLEMAHAGRERGLPEQDFAWLLERYPGIAPVAGDRRAGLVAIGINPAGHSYRYQLKFFNQSLSGGALVKGAGGGFRVTISRYEAGVPDGAPPAYTATCYGAFLGVGAGAGAGFDLNKGGSAGATGSGGSPPSCDCYSTARLEAHDFKRARFTTGAIVGPTVKGGAAGVGGSVGWTKTFFELRVTQPSPDVILNATLTTSPAEPKMSLPGADTIKKRVEEVKKGRPEEVATVGASVDLFGATKSWGVLVTGGGSVPKPDKDNPPEQGPGNRVAFVHRGDAVMAFEVGKAEIRTFLVHRLDLLLAIFRKMFESPGWVRIEGYASPEWKGLDREGARGANQALAQERTENTLTVIRQAIGDPGGPIVHEHKDVRAAGYGDAFQSRITTDLDAPRVRSGYRVILDPFCDAARTERGVERVATEKREVYPTMRRVDISADGVFIIRLGAD